MQLGLGLGITSQRSSALFVASDIPGLVVWYDADDPSTITEVTGKVSQWDDKSGNNNHATQSIGSYRPTYEASNAVANGNATLNWGTVLGEIHFQLTSTITPKWGCIIMAYKDGVDATFDAYNGIMDLGNSTNRTFGSLGTAIWHDGGANSTFAGSYTNDDTWSATALPMPLSVQSWDDTQDVALWSFNEIGREAAAGRQWQGVICECIFYDNIPSAGDITSLKDSLYTKWGITP